MKDEFERRLEEAIKEKTKLEANLTDMNKLNLNLNELQLAEKVGFSNNPQKTSLSPTRS